MLAVFSLPTRTSVLALRRERFELTKLVQQIAARQRRRIELSVVQYGATRDRLAAVAEAGDGWDVLHLSGHGGRGQFLLETPGGSLDPVNTSALLAPLRRRVKLAGDISVRVSSGHHRRDTALAGLGRPGPAVRAASHPRHQRGGRRRPNGRNGQHDDPARFGRRQLIKSYIYAGRAYLSCIAACVPCICHARHA